MHTALVDSQIRQKGHLAGRIITALRLVKDPPSLAQAIANVLCLGAYCVLVMFQVSLAPTKSKYLDLFLASPKSLSLWKRLRGEGALPPDDLLSTMLLSMMVLASAFKLEEFGDLESHWQSLVKTAFYCISLCHTVNFKRDPYRISKGHRLLCWSRSLDLPTIRVRCVKSFNSSART